MVRGKLFRKRHSNKIVEINNRSKGRTKVSEVFKTNIIVNTAHEYSQNSSLHGLRYVGNKNLHIAERLFWMISFCLATFISLYFIKDLLQRWSENPVIISLSPRWSSITEIPFPAITICNMNNVKKSVAEQILKSENLEWEQALLKDFCEEDTILGNKNKDNITSSWKMVQKFMVKVSQPCHEMIISCKWHNEVQDCNKIFNAVLTDEGMCCAFNIVKTDLLFRNARYISDLNITFPFTYLDWTPEEGYSKYIPVNHVPWRPWGAGSHLGLTLLLNAELDEYYCSSEASHGFKMTLHNPVETPKISGFGTLISPGTETQIILKPAIGIASEYLRKIDQAKRQCVFTEERYLRFYRTYTYQNCMLECESNFTLHYCDCVMYYMPKDINTRICGKQDMPCANKAKLTLETKFEHQWSNNGSTFKEKPNCGCLSSCYWIYYNHLISVSELSSLFKIKKIKNETMPENDHKHLKKNIAVVHFFYADTQMFTYVKAELFGTTELLSAAGGLLGLFMGFSFLSVFEAIYFLTLRLWCTAKKTPQIPENCSASGNTERIMPFIK